MPGRRDRNLRKGHLAEDIGVGVLRSFAAVAHVRSQDDVGVDAYAVLLRPEGRSLHAGLTIGVQFKAASERRIGYDDDATEWFKRLDVPFLFSSVDVRNGTIEFFTTNRIGKLMGQYSRIEFLMDSDEAWIDGATAYVGMAPAIVSCSETTARTDEFAALGYDLFSAWAALENENIVGRPLGLRRVARWTTNGAPDPFGGVGVTEIENRERELLLLRGYLDKLSFVILGFEQDQRRRALEALLELHEWYKSQGFDRGCLEAPDLVRTYLSQDGERLGPALRSQSAGDAPRPARSSAARLPRGRGPRRT